MTIKELLNWSEEKLAASNKEIHAAKILIMHFSKLESYEIFANIEKELDDEIVNEIKDAVDKYIDGLPVQYITGNEVFFGYEFMVNENVLIPRFETEELVEHVLGYIDEHYENYDSIDLVDIGTGSGNISITLALEEPKLKVTATDISSGALEVAKENAKSLNANVDFYLGSMYEPLKNKKFDIIVSNPPYIPKEEHVDELVKDNEPHVALFGGEDGLKYYKIIISDAKKYLNPNGMLAFEIGMKQGELLSQIARNEFPDGNVEVIKDMQDKDRILIIKL